MRKTAVKSTAVAVTVTGGSPIHCLENLSQNKHRVILEGSDDPMILERVHSLQATDVGSDTITTSEQAQPKRRHSFNLTLPCDIDILRCKFAPALPIVEMLFKSPTLNEEYQYQMQATVMSVRRDNGLRRKWLNLMGEAEAIIFLVDLSRYNETEYCSNTNEQLNCIRIAMQPTQSIIQFVIFNKFDLFTEKLTRIPFTECYPEYTGANKAAAAIQYCTQRFRGVFGFRQRDIRTWCTNCLDADQMRGIS
ncbi:G-protein alpha subunit-domain-containing protein [Mycena albidolilacea]|uniref:G-protein alpha subunit-domain-containing protein n=1 Tax=Mycena albidolilacea TaxID=1033008 RepID=A0AAD6Z3D3_9AGAR|nr:G-protein alpha subunit-domain-containing protein [Mycena albidolilacea]